ncbi:pilus assembly protein TadB [Geodermatophilus sp. DSM 44513]|uniref:pilus assembly protein TadB n=1 Tax=Geodermatophilus sp. DSM 44513 TaxID=1528104 RepID=UPI001277728A|nr:pilus assembly protein TadB [Geodermatophilus sp. DSM 44513]WNV76215.1 pilus assembly protein TadB [Geodermatophilus sp. DSM 44513]
MSGGLLLLAAALLAWPGPAALWRERRAVTPWADAGARLRAAVPLPVLAAAAATALGGLVSTPLVAVLAGGCAALAARAVLRRRAGARQEAGLAALVEALSALGAELRSGRSLDEATRAAVAACADGDSGRALARAVRAPEDDAGPAREAGELGRALARVAAAARLSTRTGCSLAAVVGAVEDDLRARSRQRLELHSATAGAQASAALLAALPVLGLLMGGGVGADPWRVLTTTATGQVLLVAGVGLEVAGLAWSARLVRRAVR